MTEDKKRGTTDNQNPKSPSSNTNSQALNNNKNTTNRDNNPAPPSLATRIQNSASGLARNAFSSSDTTQLLSTNGKASTTTPSSSSALATATEQTSGLSALSSGAQWRDRNAVTFRSPTAATAAHGGFDIPQLTEEEFARGADASLGDDTILTTSYQGKGKGKAQELYTHHPFTPSPTITNQDPNDGSAVLSLLTDKTFDPTFPPSAHEPEALIENELAHPQLTVAEMQMLETFRRHMPPDTSASTSPRRLTSASLVPDIGMILDSAPGQVDMDTAALRDSVLASLPGSEDWVAVEERYHDEVWGYLKPALEAAAKEIGERKEEGPRMGEDGPAVQRLKMILKHMRA
ncbi:hypothetical protein BBP40_007739 [Aspergillus hancockii]|nr:hypothetical protein BBP40_007739 [Aspergillus hancockii]